MPRSGSPAAEKPGEQNTGEYDQEQPGAGGQAGKRAWPAPEEEQQRGVLLGVGPAGFGRAGQVGTAEVTPGVRLKPLAWWHRGSPAGVVVSGGTA